MKDIVFKSPFEEIKIVPIADVHLGSPKCNYKLLKDIVEMIRTTPNMYCVLLGDLMNNSTCSSVGDTYTETLTPSQQMELVVKTFGPIKDKILAMNSGNHELRTYKQDGLDPTLMAACELGIRDKYDPTGTNLFIDLPTPKPMTWTMYSAHNTGAGGRTTGGKANGLEKRGQIINADIIVGAHTHEPISFKTARYEEDRIHKKHTLRKTMFVNTCSYLYYEAYAETFGMPPSVQDQPIITVGKDINCTL